MDNRRPLLILDIDGTCVEFHTNKWLPGVFDKLVALNKDGWQILFVTGRCIEDINTEWSEANTKKLLAELPFQAPYLTGCMCPRIIVDDHPCGSIHTQTNSASWIDQFQPQE